jgi:hypothetical protein
MNTEERLANMERQLVKIRRGGDIQTFFLILVFVFGITSVSDLKDKIKLK